MATLAQVMDVYSSCRAFLEGVGSPAGVPYCAGRPGGELSLGWRFSQPDVAIDANLRVALLQEVGRYIQDVRVLPGRLEMIPRHSWLVGRAVDVPSGPLFDNMDSHSGDPVIEQWDVLRRRALREAGVPLSAGCGPVSAPQSQAQDSLLTRLALLCVPPRKGVKLGDGWNARDASSRPFAVLLAFSQAAKRSQSAEDGGKGRSIHCESTAINSLRVFVSTARSLSVGDPSFCVRSMMDYSEQFLHHRNQSRDVCRRVAGTLLESSQAIKLALPQRV